MNAWKVICLCIASFAAGWLADETRHRRQEKAVVDYVRQNADKAFDELSSDGGKDARARPPAH